jgi:CRISPR/Cas system CSM-associated protein Csm3 (group 7 of RAMP superfamily)
MAGAVAVSITLTFQTPPSVAGAGAVATLADRVVLRNAAGQFIIPGSHLKGKLRHACEQLIASVSPSAVCGSPRAETMCPNPPGSPALCPICCIFGSPARRSALVFSDLVCQPDANAAALHNPAASLRAMTGMNRRRGTVADQRLFLVETAPWLPGLPFSNDSAISGKLDSVAQVRLLLAGLKLLPAWGGMKSRGLGWASVEATATWEGTPLAPADWQEVMQQWMV